ncbi:MULTISPECIES: lysophospholipid acyltransferase family protein [unclassified Ekhidna]|uniref:lysophospholipid acyltransferase family protein n=1 Tax=unclassified Ekhidna TaxID=2632188 RepID=UPI0032DEC7F6
MIGIRVVVENKHLLDEKTNYIFCPNHFSFLDILSMPHVPVPFKFVGKLSLANIPLFGYYYKNYHILVDRESKKSSYEAYKKSVEALEKGYSLTVFPEGGIHKVNEIEMSRFKRGPFKMAIETGTKLVPVTIVDNWSILPDDGKYRVCWKRRSRLVIHEPVNPEDYDVDDLQKLQSSVYNTIQRELHRRNS